LGQLLTSSRRSSWFRCTYMGSSRRHSLECPSVLLLRTGPVRSATVLISHDLKVCLCMDVRKRDRRTLAFLGCHDLNATGHLGHLFTVTFWTPYLRCFVLADAFGALERLAAFFTTILVGRHVSAPRSRSNGSNEIPLPQFNTAMPQNVVSGSAMEIEVGHHEMH
jgi:hypothetical protein